MLTAYAHGLEEFLNADAELQRRLAGFKTFCGPPDGHHRRAREQGASAAARAVRCYPFGGASALDGHELIAIQVDDNPGLDLVVRLQDSRFSVRCGDRASEPLLRLTVTRELLKKTILGRYRWLWLMGMDEVRVSHSGELPHSDWVTILEVLVAMQELVELSGEYWRQVESL